MAGKLATTICTVVHMMNTAKPYAGTQAVVRALRLLKLFHAAPQLSFAEVRVRSELNRSTAFRLLTALEAEGMLERDPATDAFRLGPQIAALGRHAAGTGDLREIARPALDGLARATRETATLEVLAAATPGQVTIVAEAMGDHLLSAVPSVGTSWPAHATSTGKVLLAELDPAERERALRGRLRAWTERTVVRKRALALELERVRRRGFATSVEELEPGYVAAAVPVRDAGGRAVAALSVGGPKHRLPRPRLEELATTLGEAASAISRELGGGAQ